MKLPLLSLAATLACWGSLTAASLAARSSAPTPDAPTPQWLSQHTDRLPTGNHHFYERDLDAMVSYVRRGDVMYGALYDRNGRVCFSANINWGSVDVRWWGDLWMLGRSGRGPISRNYTIAQFTSGNGRIYGGLDNPRAVRSCR